MNSALKSSLGDTTINVVEADRDAGSKKKSRGNSSSNPLAIGKTKQRVFGDSQMLVDNSYASSSSYGSLEEETFVRKQTPDDFQ